MTTFEPGFYPDVDEADYHTGTFGPQEGSLSQTGAKLLLKAPRLFLHEQTHPTYKKVWDFGSAAHALVLGRGIDSIYVAPFDDWRTKAAQTERDLAHANSLSPILPKDWDVVCDMADELSTHPLAMELLSEGEAEVSAYAIHEPTGVWRRGRFDWLGPTIGTDYKSAVCADPQVWRKDAAKHGCHIQAPFYQDLALDLGHPMKAFAFVVQEKTAPYLVQVIELDDAAMNRGRELYTQALERFRDCRAAGVWPGYPTNPDGFTRISLPGWAFTDAEEYDE